MDIVNSGSITTEIELEHEGRYKGQILLYAEYTYTQTDAPNQNIMDISGEHIYYDESVLMDEIEDLEIKDKTKKNMLLKAIFEKGYDSSMIEDDIIRKYE